MFYNININVLIKKQDNNEKCNGYYSSNLALVLTDGKDFNKTYDISECQDINGD